MQISHTKYGTIKVPDNFWDLDDASKNAAISAGLRGDGPQPSGGGLLGPKKEAQLGSLFDRGIPSDKALKATEEDSQGFYQANKQISDFKSSPEYNALNEAWEKLSDEEKESYWATSPYVAAGASFLDNVLPFPVIWMIGDQFEAQLRHAMKINKGSTDAAAVVGTLLGLIGGVGALKAGARLLVDAIAQGPRGGGRASARAVKDLVSDTKKLKGEGEDLLARSDISPEGRKVIEKLTSNMDKDINNAENFAKGVRELYHRFGLNVARESTIESLESMPKNSITRRALDTIGHGTDWFANQVIKDVRAGKYPTNWFEDYLSEPLKRKLQQFASNWKYGTVELSASVMAGFAAEYTYALSDQIKQGKSWGEANDAAFKYAKIRSLEDFTAAGLDAAGLNNLSKAMKAYIGASDVTTTGNIAIPGEETTSPTLLDLGAGVVKAGTEAAGYNKGGIFGINPRKVPMNYGGLFSTK